MLPIEVNEGCTFTASVWRETDSKYRFHGEEEENLQFVKSVITNEDNIHLHFKAAKKLNYAKFRLTFKIKHVVAVQITKQDDVSKVFYMYPGIQSIVSFRNYGGDFAVVLDADEDYAKLKQIYPCYLRLRTSLVDVAQPFQPPWRRRAAIDGDQESYDVVDGCGIPTTMGTSTQQFREVQKPPGRLHSSRVVHLFIHVDVEEEENNLIELEHETLV